MNKQNEGMNDIEYWQYDRPPTLYDYVQNNIISNFLRIVIHIFIRYFLKCFHRLEIHDSGGNDLTSGIIIANHSSHLDIPVIFSAFPLSKINKIRSLAAEDYFFGNSLIRMITFFIANTIPLNRNRYNPESFSYCKKWVDKNNCIAVFPEGTRTTDGEMKVFKAGIGMLALHCQMPVLPVYIKGTYECLKKGSLFPKPGKIDVFLGKKISYNNLENSKASWQYIAGDLEKRIRELMESSGIKNEKNKN